MTNDSEFLYLFADGVEIGSTYVYGYSSVWNDDSYLIVGSSGDAVFSGLIDEVRISSVARYTADFTPEDRFTVDSDTLALWHFDEGTGTTATDEVSGLVGTLSGGAAFELR
jgi:hypothetical protein